MLCFNQFNYKELPMPMYDYECPKCSAEFDMLLTIKEFDSDVECPNCGATAVRVIRSCPSIRVGSSLSRIRDSFQPGWNHALGMNITSKTQYREELKRRGLREVGNDAEKRTSKDKPMFNEESIKSLKAQGAEISDKEATALINGEKLHKE